MRYKLRIAGLTGLLLCSFAAQGARADSVVANFTRSMASLHVVALMCQDTLSPSPAYYAKMLRDYLAMDPIDNYYWSLPVPADRIKDKRTCFYRLQKELMNYNAASDVYYSAYPGRPVPPTLALHRAHASADPLLQKSLSQDAIQKNRRPRSHMQPRVIDEWGY